MNLALVFQMRILALITVAVNNNNNGNNSSEQQQQQYIENVCGDGRAQCVKQV